MSHLAKFPALSGHPGQRRILVISMLALLSMLGGGCAAVSNPVGQGVPVRRLPPEYFAVPKIDAKTIPLTMLRQTQPEEHRVDADDVLGVFIDGVTGDKGALPPFRMPDQNVPTPAVGYPYFVSQDGTLPLPQIQPLQVRGMTIGQVREAIIKAYTEDNKIIKVGPGGKGTAAVQILVSLMRPRHVRVEVFRQETGAVLATGFIAGNSRKGTAAVVELRAYENDIGHALAQTGGLPALDAINEVVIQRGNPPASPSDKGSLQTIRIPIRMRPGESIPFRPDDVVLKKGDIVFVESRDTEVYYVGGLAFPKQYILPRDYDLTVVAALAVANGPLVNGGVTQNNLSGNIIASGLGSPSPSYVTVLRRTKENGQIPIHVDLNRALNDPRENIILQSGDVIVLQETLGEAMSRYFSSVLRYNYIFTAATPTNLFTGSAAGP